MKNYNYPSLPFPGRRRVFSPLIIIMAAVCFFASASAACAQQFGDLKLPAISVAPAVKQRKSESGQEGDTGFRRNSAAQNKKSDTEKTAPADLRLLNLRIADGEERQGGFSLIAVFNRKPEFSFLALGRPPRLIMNLPAAQFNFSLDSVDKSGRLASLRYGASGKAGARLIFGLKSPFRVAAVNSESLASAAFGAGWQIEVRLAPASEEEFMQYLRKQGEAGSSAAPGAEASPERGDQVKKAAAAPAEGVGGAPFVVAIDPGHGDFDSGAVSADGVKEKDITLAFAKVFYRILQRKPGIKPYLTRSGDEYLKLGVRTDKARDAGADLFISIHADHIDAEDLHGATVYTLSGKASDAMAKSLADYENKADLLGGASVNEPPAVSDILMEMTQRETRGFSESFASLLVKNLRRGGIALIKNPHRSANFQVLRVADIPSVLVEIGYLSNKRDEENITSPAWQEKMAAIMADSVAAYARAHRGGH